MNEQLSYLFSEIVVCMRRDNMDLEIKYNRADFNNNFANLFNRWIEET